MPSTLSQITANFFVNLITRLGVRPPPPDAFMLSNVVMPVSLVDTDLSLPVVLSTLLLGGNSNTAGELTNPAPGTLLADTGPLAGGNWSILVWLGIGGGTVADADFRIQRRDATNATSIWSQYGSIALAGQPFVVQTFSTVLALNERVRVISGPTVIGAGVIVQATVWFVQTG